MTKVFTNGCFDILHPGHVDLLERCKSLGTELIVGINSDESVRKIKGAERPFLDQASRKAILCGLKSVDEVYIFEELTPENLIKQINPNVLVKGGDWKIEEIIGADFVIKNGGKVFSLPLKGDFSTSGIAEKIRNAGRAEKNSVKKMVSRESDFSVATEFRQHIEIFERMLKEQIDSIAEAHDLLEETFERGKKLLLCGDNDSAAVAQYIATSFVEQNDINRRVLPVVALARASAAQIPFNNDDDFAIIYADQIEASANEGDCLLAVSASGNSPNVIAAAMSARRKNCRVIALTGAGGKKLASLSDVCAMVPSQITARILEAHIAIAHIWRERLERI